MRPLCISAVADNAPRAGSRRRRTMEQAAAHRSPPSALRRWQAGRLGLIAALAALALAGGMIYRGVRIIQLRTLALDASEARQAGNWQRLEWITNRWLAKDPEAATAWLLAAEAAQYQQAPGRVASYLERLPEDDPRTPVALLELATTYYGPLNQPLKGEATCLKSLQLQPDNIEARRRLIFYYAMTLQRAKMVEFAREAIAAGNDAPETYVYLIGADWITLSNAAAYNAKWLQSGDDPETFLVGHLIHWAGSTGLDATADFEDAAAETALASDPALKSRIEALLGGSQRGGWANHRERLRACFQTYPENPELISYELAEASSKGDADRVAELLATVPASAADDNRFFHYKGWLHDARGETELAVQAYRHALQLNPFDWRSQLKLAVALRLVGETDEADRLADLGIAGKELREAIMQLADVQSIPMPVLLKMQDYCRRCGDDFVADGLASRIEMIDAIRRTGSVESAPR